MDYRGREAASPLRPCVCERSGQIATPTLTYPFFFPDLCSFFRLGAGQQNFDLWACLRLPFLSLRRWKSQSVTRDFVFVPVPTIILHQKPSLYLGFLNNNRNLLFFVRNPLVCVSFYTSTICEARTRLKLTSPDFFFLWTGVLEYLGYLLSFFPLIETLSVWGRG